MTKCNCDWCIGTAGSDDLSLAEKAVREDEARRRRENDPASQDRRREVDQLLRKIGAIE